MKPVVGIGIACLDHLIVIPENDREGGHISHYRVEGGGLTASALVAAARLGAPTQFWTCLGDDDAGHAILGGLAREGIDTRGIRVVAGARSPVSIVHVESPSGDRRIYHFRGDAFEKAGPLPTFHGLERAGALLVDYCWHEGALAGARLARGLGVPVIGDFDPRCDPELAAAVDSLIVGEQAAESLSEGRGIEAALRRLHEFGPSFVAVTAGARGCWYSANAAVRHCPAIPVEVVDTPGAGDAFHGACAFGMAQGWPIDETIRLASAVGALACTALGGRAGLPDLAAALAFLGRSAMSAD